VRFEVDLARVPKGASNELPELINHYTAGAQAGIQSKIGSYYIQKPDHQRGYDHYEWSVRKNREIFMKDLKPEYLSSVKLHQTAAGKAESKEAEGFTPDMLKEMGAKVGVPQYDQGFQDGLAAKPSEEANVNATYQKYYKEGYADAQEYLRGYNYGKRYQNRANNREFVRKQLDANASIRYQQGFWDGVYKRAYRK
jgi:hypothetical protein